MDCLLGILPANLCVLPFPPPPFFISLSRRRWSWCVPRGSSLSTRTATASAAACARQVCMLGFRRVVVEASAPPPYPYPRALTPPPLTPLLQVRPLRRQLLTLKAWVTGQRKDQSPGTRDQVPVVQVRPPPRSKRSGHSVISHSFQRPGGHAPASRGGGGKPPAWLRLLLRAQTAPRTAKTASRRPLRPGAPLSNTRMPRSRCVCVCSAVQCARARSLTDARSPPCTRRGPPSRVQPRAG
jgi:hypothetical protein